MSSEVSFPGLGISVNIDSVAFTIFGLDIAWYGLIISCGMALCVILAMYQARKNKFSSELVLDIMIVSVPMALIGARLYYVLSEWSYYSKHLSDIFAIRDGGLAVYGGVLGAFLGNAIMMKIRKIPFSTCADYAVVYIPLGQAIGRWGNFFNEEAFGTTTTLPWGMTSNKIQAYLRMNCPELDSTMPVHPTFLYESICSFIIFFVLMYIRKKSKHAYETTASYMILYGIVRFFLEGIRTDSLYIGNTSIRTSQLLSLILVIGGIALIIVSHKLNWTRKPLPEAILAKDVKLFEEEAKVEDAKDAKEESSTLEANSENEAAMSTESNNEDVK